MKKAWLVCVVLLVLGGCGGKPAASLSSAGGSSGEIGAPSESSAGLVSERPEEERESSNEREEETMHPTKEASEPAGQERSRMTEEAPVSEEVSREAGSVSETELPPVGRVNAAVEKVQKLSRMPEEAAGGVRLYGSEMDWRETEGIQNLERYTAADGDGDYFLVLPQYNHSAVMVSALTWQEETGELVPGEIQYECRDTPEDYGLLLEILVPEGIPALRVTVTGGGITANYDISYVEVSCHGQRADPPILVNGLYYAQ